MTTAALSKDKDSVMPTIQRVSADVQHQVEHFLYSEAAVLDQEQVSHWVNAMLDPAIRYQMVIRDERHVRDKAQQSARELMIYDDDLFAINLRLRQFETGLQRMMDPGQYIRRFISNIRATAADTDGQFNVVSYGKAYRFRREYDQDEVVYERNDLICREGDSFRILHRRIDLFQRVIRSKNLLFFL